MREILNSYSASDLKKEISKYNKKVAIRGYSKMTKSELVNAMMKHQDTFNYLKKKEKAPKPAPKPAPKKEESSNLLDDLKKFTDKYNANEIKKQKFTKQNIDNFTNPYFDLLKKIQKKLDNLDDQIKFFKDNKKLSMSFADIKKNFLRRIKAQIKKSK